jgi:hypothetical protein
MSQEKNPLPCEKAEQQKKKHQEELIDEALRESFPASDPPTPYRVLKSPKTEPKEKDSPPGQTKKTG